MSTTSRGTARELAVKRVLERDGWWVHKPYQQRRPSRNTGRGYASTIAPIDLIAIRPLESGGCAVHFVQVKANKGSPYQHFRAEERAALRVEAIKAGAEAVLIHWPPRGVMLTVRSEHWPSSVDT